MRRPMRKVLLLLAVVAALGAMVAGASTAQACGRGCCYSCYNSCYTSCYTPVWTPDIALRQCKGTYFNVPFSVWTEVDVMVPFYQAAVGLTTDAWVPGMGDARVWITEVYTVPRVSPPPFKP